MRFRFTSRGLSFERVAGRLVVVLMLWASMAHADETYKHGPDSEEREGMPRGKVDQFKWIAKGKHFHGTRRDYWVYVPAQYDPAKPACAMVFQDGGGFVQRTGDWRVPTVFDNLIQKKEMPVTIGIFINPGVITPPKWARDALPRFNRSFEYDSMTDEYANFLLDPDDGILAEVGKRYNLARDGNSRAICGASSGAVAAFVAAWHRPKEFSRVVSFIGSFTNLRGGNYLPDAIRKTEPKPIRVFLQDGRNDLNIYAGHWPAANTDMAEALKFAGYDYQFVLGDEGHNGQHGGAIFPEAVKWVWHDYPKPVESFVTPSRQPIMDVIDQKAGWQQVGDTYRFTEGPAADAHGNVFFSDIPNSRIYRIDPAAKVTLFAEDTGGGNGLMFGPDGKLYCCQMARNRVVAYDERARERVVAEDIRQCNDLCVNRQGGIYVTEPPEHRVWYISPKGDKRIVARDPLISFPNGIRFTPDQSQIIVADTRGVRLWAFQVEPDGQLANREAYYDAQIQPGQADDGADGMCLDREGRLYVATLLGLQVFDQAGRVIGIINKPQDQWLANVCFGGPDLDYLYVACGDHVYRRKTKTRGVLSWQNPVKPAAPKL